MWIVVEIYLNSQFILIVHTTVDINFGDTIFTLFISYIYT